MEEEIKKLLEENLKLTREMHVVVKKLYRQIIWGKIKFFIKIALFVIMSYLSYKFLPPLISQLIAPYKPLLGQVQQLQGGKGFSPLEILGLSQGKEGPPPTMIEELLKQVGGAEGISPELQKLIQQSISSEKTKK